MVYRRVLTPPSAIAVEDYDELQCPGGSASTTASRYPRDEDWSPASAMTAATTPPRSPANIRESGPLLLPRVRAQDQFIEPAGPSPFSGHSRTTSMPTNGFPIKYGGDLRGRQPLIRRSISPAANAYPVSPVSARSPCNYYMRNDLLSVEKAIVGSTRPASATHIRSQSSHSRHSSSSSIDASLLSRYGYPTYRHSPTPQPLANSAPLLRVPSAMNHLAPIAMSAGPMQPYSVRRRTASPPANPSTLSTEVNIDPNLDSPTSNALDYLTAPNPTPALTHRTVESGRGQNTHFWYDIRNIRAWSDFSVAAISDIPDLMRLLRFPIPASYLPAPGKVNLNPENARQLADCCAAHHAVKVNAVLKLTQGMGKHMSMRTLRSAPGARQQPEFVSNYHSDVEKTIYGDGRGRVIGVVKCYDQWNSGMRNGSPGDKVKYLQGLAHLHRFMREHGTRYGFLMTEIEVVCVRAGGPAAESSNVPLFGYLEVAAPVQVATSGRSDGGRVKMTATLALWWLHMLAKEQPMPGQVHWRLDVGGPAALTRHHHLPRDDWIPKPNVSEKREAKRVRGWVMPDEPLSKRECGRGRRSRA